MAALSCYQPCRSHLAQPARCFNEEDRYPPPSLQYRRRQFIERCHEARGTRHRDPIPAEVSVKKTRDELTKNAVQNTPFNRRLNIESGWSKVEEVRKKFEGATTVSSSFSRSFESPPRRRLADSLFASFKLPRKKENMSQPRSLMHQQHQSKRKSAVELLAETKAFYVKSETVLDRKQELPLRMSSGLGQAIASGGCHLVSSGTLNQDVCCNPYGTTRGLVTSRRAVSAGDGLQNTLRRLLEHSDSRENVYSPPVYAIPHKVCSDARRLKECYDPRSQLTSGTFSGTSSSGTSGSKPHHRTEESRDYKRPLSFNDARVFFPESFVIPRQRASECVVRNNYVIPSSHSSPENMELPDPVLSPEEGGHCDEIGAISPPAQYAHSTQSRSNSQCQTQNRQDQSNNINSHKSLPDLHTHVRCYNEHGNVIGIETIGRSPRRRRHSAHQRTASCSSKGTRSNHSSLMSSCDGFSEHPSPGDETYQYNSRCGSSFARDSGGSSGHYTQRSAPPHPAPRNDTVITYGSYPTDQMMSPTEEWVSAPPQFQDGAPSPPPTSRYPATHTHSIVGIHFQASAPPPQFQDEPTMYEYDICKYKPPIKCMPLRKECPNRKVNRYHEMNTEMVSKQPQYQEVRVHRRDDMQDYVNATQICQQEEVTSPLGTFKRQRCLRYKQRHPRPILRSKSDISDRYRRNDGRSSSSAPCEGEESPSSTDDSVQRLHRFFETLGLEDHAFDTIVTEPALESPIFFSDASTVDSNQLAQDYTVNGPPQKQVYRNMEPPSIVERNARIIKWLCNCRKIQQGPLS